MAKRFQKLAINVRTRTFKKKIWISQTNRQFCLKIRNKLSLKHYRRIEKKFFFLLWHIGLIWGLIIICPIYHRTYDEITYYFWNKLILKKLWVHKKFISSFYWLLIKKLLSWCLEKITIKKLKRITEEVKKAIESEVDSKPNSQQY